MNFGARKGLTVLELVIILVIVGLLLLIVIPRFTGANLQMVTAPDSLVAPGVAGEMAVRVTNRSGAPQRGAKVEFEVTNGSVNPSVVETDSTGMARTSWRAGADTGTMRLVAHLDGRTTPEVTATVKIRGTPLLPAAPPPAQTPAATPPATAPDTQAAATKTPGTKQP